MSDDFQTYRNRALHLLKYRPRSVAEVERRLKKAGAEEVVIAQVIDSLIEHQLLNDEEFAIWLAKSRLNHKRRGAFAIQAELRQFGISRKIIRATLAHFSREDFIQAATEYLQAKFRDGITDYDEKQKAYRRLSSRGFSTDIIKTAIDAWQSGK